MFRNGRATARDTGCPVHRSSESRRPTWRSARLTRHVVSVQPVGLAYSEAVSCPRDATSVRSFDYITPGSLAEALEAMARHAPHVRLLAGGTDLLVDLKHTVDGPEVVIDLSRISELRGINKTSASLRIGAMVTHTEIQRAPLIAEHAPAMIDAAATIGAVQTRNMGTIGGNLVTCVPSLDSGPVLVSLDAQVTVAGAT